MNNHRTSKPKKLSSEEKERLVSALLACPSIADRDSRMTVIGQLHFKAEIKNHPKESHHVFNVVETCCRYPEGIRQLIERLTPIQTSNPRNSPPTRA